MVILGACAESTTPPLPVRDSLIEITPGRGFYETAQTIRLTSRRAGVQIRFTTDGTVPIAASRVFSDPFLVDHQTILRAAAFEGNQRVSAVATQSYLFLADVLRQPRNPAGLPSGPTAWNGVPSAYEMDPRVVEDPAYRPRMKDALLSLPTVSVVCAPADLFSARRGLYLNSQERGDAWERPCSVEWVMPDGSAGFQADCGIQMQGNYNRIPEKSPKHSFRLLFKAEYGSGRLKFPVFPDSPVTNFNTLILRAGYNNTWVHWEADQRSRAHPARDAWMKDTQRALGWLAGHNRFVHLYLNGIYWGLYDIAERPDAVFAASHLGGTREDYDVINESQVKDGTGEAFARLRSLRGLADPARYRLLDSQLDLTRFLDYLLLNYYAGNQDWGERKNWYAIRRRIPSGPFLFLAWDGEHVFEDLSDDTVQRPYEAPFRLTRELMANPEFRLAFADRVQKHCFGDGALTPAAAADRWLRRSGQIDLAIIAESARWGYYHRQPPFTRDRDWMAEQRRMIGGYFPRRTAVLLRQLRAAGLFPEIPAPVLQKTNSISATEKLLTLTPSERGDIYFTTDGSDPRQATVGAVSPKAARYSEPVAMRVPGVLKARVLSGSTWSPLTEIPLPTH